MKWESLRGWINVCLLLSRKNYWPDYNKTRYVGIWRFNITYNIKATFYPKIPMGSQTMYIICYITKLYIIIYGMQMSYNNLNIEPACSVSLKNLIALIKRTRGTKTENQNQSPASAIIFIELWSHKFTTVLRSKRTRSVSNLRRLFSVRTYIIFWIRDLSVEICTCLWCKFCLYFIFIEGIKHIDLGNLFTIMNVFLCIKCSQSVIYCLWVRKWHEIVVLIIMANKPCKSKIKVTRLT